MHFSTARSERITAVISTVVAVAILAGGVTAYQSHSAPVEDIVQLESDFRFQLEVGFRHDHQERAKRLKQLEVVTQAWEQSPRSTTDRKKLSVWLLEATIRSMPGANEPLPAVPSFGVEPPANQAPQTPDVLVKPAFEEEAFEPASQAPTPAAPPSREESAATAEPAVYKSAPTTNFKLEQASTQPIAKPHVAAITPPKALAPVRINLTELAARIAGYHAGLDEVERTVGTLGTQDVAALTEQVRQLENMTRDFRFVQLYYQTLTNKERRTIAVPRSMDATLASIERRLEQTQSALSGDFLGEFDASHQDRVGELRQLLAKITTSVN